jgi:hypothetical protein
LVAHSTLGAVAADPPDASPAPNLTLIANAEGTCCILVPMATSPRKICIEELLEHAGWVRTLAGALVHDSAEADDVVQETGCRRCAPHRVIGVTCAAGWR